MKWWRQTLCRLGWHSWIFEQDTFSTEYSGNPKVIGWYRCERCHKAKLEHIL
jgi:hypothetical protein